MKRKKAFSNLNTKNGTGERLDGAPTPMRKNIHPCVKNTNLMWYLVRLVAPKGAIILDPFMGSDSTGKAVMIENFSKDKNYKFIGVELEEKYFDIAKARIDYIIKNYSMLASEELEKENIKVDKSKPTTIFDFLDKKEE